ncbi:MAG: hypothetical protein K0U78_16700 [Actinomycetia bacterium]|nr:hypothetical protein [Actinomycetes bacterium]
MDPLPYRAAPGGPTTLPTAEVTDNDALGCYSANHFLTTSLGEKYPDIERRHLPPGGHSDIDERRST